MTITAIATGTKGSIRIIYDFVSVDEEAYLITKINDIGGPPITTIPTIAELELTPPKPSHWKSLNGRRTLQWGGSITASNHLIKTPLPLFMDGSFPDVFKKIRDSGVWNRFGRGVGPNHCLVNEYSSTSGIMPHTDGPAYTPLISTLSLQSHTILSLRPSVMSPKSDEISVFVPKRSLLVTDGELYEWCHGIEWRENGEDSIDQLRECKNWDEWSKRIREVEWDDGDDEEEEALTNREATLHNGLKGLNLAVSTTRSTQEAEFQTPTESTSTRKGPTSSLNAPSSTSTSVSPNAANTQLIPPSERPRSETDSPIEPSSTISTELPPEKDPPNEDDEEDRLKSLISALESGSLTSLRRDTRISLTCRRVEKVRDLSALMKGISSKVSSNAGGITGRGRGIMRGDV